MADDEKDTKETQPNTPNPAQAQREAAATTTASPSAPLAPPPVVDPAVIDEDDDVVAAHQAVIKAEQELGQTQVKAQSNLQKALDGLEKARAKASGADPDAETFPGFHHKTWGTHDALQCAYCPWDVITSSMFNYVDRMKEHLAAAHPNWQQLPVRYDQAGNFLEGEVQ